MIRQDAPTRDRRGPDAAACCIDDCGDRDDGWLIDVEDAGTICLCDRHYRQIMARLEVLIAEEPDA